MNFRISNSFLTRMIACTLVLVTAAVSQAETFYFTGKTHYVHKSNTLYHFGENGEDLGVISTNVLEVCQTGDSIYFRNAAEHVWHFGEDGMIGNGPVSPEVISLRGAGDSAFLLCEDGMLLRYDDAGFAKREKDNVIEIAASRDLIYAMWVSQYGPKIAVCDEFGYVGEPDVTRGTVDIMEFGGRTYFLNGWSELFTIKGNFAEYGDEVEMNLVAEGVTRVDDSNDRMLVGGSHNGSSYLMIIAENGSTRTIEKQRKRRR